MASLGHVSERDAGHGWPQPARLSVGIVSAGRVGTAVGAALERAGHVVSGCVAGSDDSVARAHARLPETRILEVEAVASAAELLILAVPDTELKGVVDRLAASGVGFDGRIVAHTSGANGVGILAPLAEDGATCLAIHPAMTFTGDAADTDRLASACFGVTASDQVGLAIAQSLVLESGGEPVIIPEQSRTLYHAALAHGSNHLVTLVRDASTALAAALRGPEACGDNAGGPVPIDGAPTTGGTITGQDGAPERILAPLLTAALDNALRFGDRALTGPVARGDGCAVDSHLRVLAEEDAGIAESYRALALRTARRAQAPTNLIDRLEERST